MFLSSLRMKTIKGVNLSFDLYVKMFELVYFVLTVERLLAGCWCNIQCSKHKRPLWSDLFV